MPDYRVMYYELAAKVADAVELLVTAQQQGEGQFVEEGESFSLPISQKLEEDEKEKA